MARQSHQHRSIHSDCTAPSAAHLTLRQPLHTSHSTSSSIPALPAPRTLALPPNVFARLAGVSTIARVQPASIASALPRCTAVAIAPISWRVISPLVHVPILNLSPSPLLASISRVASVAIPPHESTDTFNSSAPMRDATAAYFQFFFPCCCNTLDLPRSMPAGVSE